MVPSGVITVLPGVISWTNRQSSPAGTDALERCPVVPAAMRSVSSALERCSMSSFSQPTEMTPCFSNSLAHAPPRSARHTHTATHSSSRPW